MIIGAKISTFWDHIVEAEEQTNIDKLKIVKDLKAAGADNQYQFMLESVKYLKESLR